MKYFSTISFCPLLSLLDVKGNIPNALHVRRMTETGDRTPKYPNDFPKMFIKIFMIVCAVLTLTSCGDKENSELQTVFVDNDREDVLPLSEIADEIKAVEPELTDESLLNIDHVLKVLLADEYIVVCEWDKIFVFD
ncbi:MAG: hypothetical protein LBT42_00030, partial [Tannerella sp.]|nr:hypothetical protein [Tannerella sp.]